MNSKTKPGGNLVILTLRFPHPICGEPYIVDEVWELSKYFENIIILPTESGKNRDLCYELPSNVRVLEIDERLDGISRKEIVTTLYAFPLFFFRSFISSALNDGLWKYLRHYKSFIGHFVKEMRACSILNGITHEDGMDEAIYYSYWFCAGTLSLSYLKSKQSIKYAISRAHNYDLFDERQFEGVVPYRSLKASLLDLVIPISQHGASYFNKKTQDKFAPKVFASYLGIRRPEKRPFLLEICNNAIVFLSCSRVVEIKNVAAIPVLLSSFRDIRVHWVHIGGGPLLETVQDIASKYTHLNFSYTMTGHLHNSIVRKFMAEHRIDYFISASSVEGIPVSMMEALSCGIPLLSTRFDAVHEIVTPETGIIYSLNEEMRDPGKLQRKLESSTFDKHKIVEFATRFDAQNNYRDFASKIFFP